MSSDSASSCSPSAALPVPARFVIFVLFLFLLSWFCSCSPCFVVFVFFIWLICSCYDCVRFVPTDTSLFVWFLGGCWVRYWCLQGGGRRVWLPAGLVAGGFDPLILGRVSSRRWGKVMRDQIFVFRSCVEVFGWLAGVGCVFLSPVTFLARRRWQGVVVWGCLWGFDGC
jgi:hypothetical protein